MKLEDVEIKNSVLIIVDVQNDFFHEKGGMGSKNISVGRGKNDVFEVQKVVLEIMDIISHARRLQVPVIFIQSLYSEWTDSPSYKKRGLTGGADYRRHCRPGTWGSDFYRVKPQPNDYVVIKHRHSAFIDTDLELVLRSRGIETIVLTGIATNVCVESKRARVSAFQYRDLFWRGCNLKRGCKGLGNYNSTDLMLLVISRILSDFIEYFKY
ncbi:MAG: cysteine hydrolase [Deltaproteobacteria bacterium]|nr:cysteine hydrolase [Deltaproteobacteria bacterium]